MTVTVAVILGLLAWCALSVVVALLIGGVARVRDRQVPGRVHEPAEAVEVTTDHAATHAATHGATRRGDRAARTSATRVSVSAGRS